MREASFRYLIARGLGSRTAQADAGKPGGTAMCAFRPGPLLLLGNVPRGSGRCLNRWRPCRPSPGQSLYVYPLARWLETSPAFALAFSEEDNEDADGSNEPQAAQLDDDRDDPEPERPLRIRRLILRPPVMRPRPLGPEACTLFGITTDADLTHWLQLSHEQLCWLAPSTPLVVEHYRYSLQPSRRAACVCSKRPRWNQAVCSATSCIRC